MKMNGLFTSKIGWIAAAYALIDIMCLGLGMGIPFFCILLGFPVGGYLALRIASDAMNIRQMLAKVLLAAAVTSGFTLVAMAVLWGWCIKMLFDPAADIANFGIPMILYEPKASLIGWLILMIVISPFLQLLMTLFGFHVTMLRRLSRSERMERSHS